MSKGAGTAPRSLQPVLRTGWAPPRPDHAVVSCYLVEHCDQIAGAEKVLPTAPISKNLNQSEPPWYKCPSMGFRADPTGPGPPGRVRAAAEVAALDSGRRSVPSLPRLEPGPAFDRHGGQSRHRRASPVARSRISTAGKTRARCFGVAERLVQKSCRKGKGRDAAAGIALDGDES